MMSKKAALGLASLLILLTSLPSTGQIPAGSVRIQDATGTTLAPVSTATPGGTEAGVYVRNIPSGTQTVAGTITANQGAANATPWNDNIAQWGGTATTLGQKVATSSLPVIPASDWISVDPTFKAAHVSPRPPEVLGCYAVNGTISYTATAANTILFSFRWGDATRIALIMNVQVHVVATSVTTAGLVERQLIVIRSFTISDTGGTVLTPTLSNQKLRTSFGTSLVTDIRVGVLTAGTGTADTAPLSSAAGWMAAVGPTVGERAPVTLFDATGGFQYPLILAQNEGFRVRFGAAETASTRQSFFNVVWCETNAF